MKRDADFRLKRDSDTLHEPGEPRLEGGRIYSLLDLMGATITCDQCGRWQRLESLDETDARDKATAMGWAQRENRDLCRICVSPQD